MAAAGTPVWVPTAQTRVDVPGFVAMHGGPTAMRLPEHEHADVQLEAHFSPRAIAQEPASALADTFRLIPSGKPHVGSWKEGSEVVVVLLSTQQLQLASDELVRVSRFELGDEFWGSDPVVQAVAGVLRRDFLSGTSDPVFLEAVRTVLAGHLVRTFRDSSLRQIRGRLSPRLLRIAIEMIENNLSKGVSVDELATRCGMGTHQFTQLFRASTGSSPYKYILNFRMERAKVCLSSSSKPLAEIAYELGFASQSHFSTSFRQHVQISPQKFRRMTRRP